MIISFISVTINKHGIIIQVIILYLKMLTDSSESKGFVCFFVCRIKLETQYVVYTCRYHNVTNPSHGYDVGIFVINM